MRLPTDPIPHRVREYARRRYTVTCTACPDLAVHANGAVQAAQVVVAHEATCDTGRAVGNPHPDRERRR